MRGQREEISVDIESRDIYFYNGRTSYPQEVTMIRLTGMILCLSAAYFSVALAQPDTIWTRNVGTDGHDLADDVVANKFGYLVLGTTDGRGEGDYDLFLVQTNDIGDTLWTRTYGGPGYDVGFGITVADDSSYVLLGVTNSFGHGSTDIYLVKVGPLGDTIWTSAIGGTSEDWGYSISRNRDGGFVIAGKTYVSPDSGEQALIVRTDAEGRALWQRTFGGINSELARQAKEVSDGGFIMVGQSESYDPGPYRSVYVVRTSYAGTPIWIKDYGGPSSDEGDDILEIDGGHFIVCGRTYSYGNGDWDAYFMRITADGDTVWTRTCGGTEWDAMHSMVEAPGGGYVSAGHTLSFGNGDFDVYIVKIDPGGFIQWTLAVGNYSQDDASAIKLTDDNRYILAGHTYLGNYDFYLVRLSAEQVAVYDTLSQPLPDDFRLLSNYPNPFNAATNLHYYLPEVADVNLSVVDINGRLVATLAVGLQEAGHHFVTWDAADIASGIYFARLTSGERTETLSMVLLK